MTIWELAERAAKQVAKWPPWKRNAADTALVTPKGERRSFRVDDDLSWAETPEQQIESLKVEKRCCEDEIAALEAKVGKR